MSFRLARLSAENRATSRRRRSVLTRTAHGRLEALEERALLTAGIALDPTFGQGGLVKTDQLGVSSDSATSISITQPDGKILVAGDADQPYVGDHFLLSRYDANGTLDTSFGNEGFVTSTFGDKWNAYAMAVDGRGHIIVVGDADIGSTDAAAIVEYNADGSLNTSFGSNGMVTTGFGNVIASARGVAIDSAGNIDITGDVYRSTQTSQGYQLFVARLEPDGTPDPNFGVDRDGAAFSAAGTYGNAIALDGSGNLVVAGQTGFYGNSQALVARFTSAGVLDTTFNHTGYATTNFGAATYYGATVPAVANSVAIDGNEIVIAGDTPNSQGQRDVIGLARYTSLGALDTTFGYGGVVTTADNTSESGDTAGGLAIDSSGSIIVAAQTRSQYFAALRFTANGRTVIESDVSFGPTYYANQASAVALTSTVTPTGTATVKIVLAGQVSNSLDVNHLALARLNADGSIDTSFGTDQTGTVVSSFQTSVLNGAQAVVIQSDGMIVTAGSAWPDSGRVFSVSRYQEDGTLDPNFGHGGTVDTDMTTTYPKYDDYANAVALDTINGQQRIIVAGQVDHPGGGMDIALARYMPNGDLDPSFGNGGIVITTLVPGSNNSANVVTVLANGDILVAGATSQPQSNMGSNFVLARYTSKGDLDTTFGTLDTTTGARTGWVQTDFSGSRDIAYAMALQTDGKIVLAGSAFQSNTGDDFALARYNADGSLDTTFGAPDFTSTSGARTGKVTTDFGPTNYVQNSYAASQDDAYGVTIDGQGRIIAAGSSNNTADAHYGFALARYNVNGTLDTLSFGSGGKVITAASTSGNSFAGPVLVTPAGKILAGGVGAVAGQDRNFMIARYDEDGSLDGTFTAASSASPAGVANTDFGGGADGDDQIYGMALDHEGRLIAAGGTHQPASNYDTGLARYVLDSTLTANAGGPYTIQEGDSLTLAATASGGDGKPLTYSWDVNGDGTYGDVVGSSQNLTLTWQQLEAVGINNGPATFQVSLRVRDAHGEYVVSQPTTLTVNDTPPTASVSGSSVEVVGQPQSFILSAIDPSPVDTAAGFSYVVNWGDGSTPQNLTASEASGPITHVFTASATYTIQVWATDEDGQQSKSPGTSTAVVQSAAMEGDTLFVGGNNVILQPGDANGGISATVDGVAQRVFYPTAGIVIYGQAGGDNIQLNQAGKGRHLLYVNVPAVIFGGAGDDILDARGSSANDVLVGGAGNDVLYGGSGRNLLIGGGGADTLYGGNGDDILIGGATAYDANLDALDAIMAEWGRTDRSYQQRVADLSSAASGGLNGSSVLNGSTVYDDDDVDDLVGGRGNDWYFAGVGDQQVSKTHGGKIR